MTDTASVTIERAVADDLVRAIYAREGWAIGDRGGFDTRSARCNSLYTITADPRRNRYIAVRKAIPHPARLNGEDL